MNEPTLQKIAVELRNRLYGQKFGKIFALSRLELAIDFRLDDGKYLFISVQPNSPRVYLIKRKLKSLEKQNTFNLSFVAFLRKQLANSSLDRIAKLTDERILKFFFTGRNELGQINNFILVIQLTGRSSNLFILDQNEVILDSLRETEGDGQGAATKYKLPEREFKGGEVKREVFHQGEYETISDALDIFYREKQAHERFRSKAKAAEGIVNKELKKKVRLGKRLGQDLKNHGDAEKWKHLGDVLLANVATAKRQGDELLAVDYFDSDLPTIAIPADENSSITEAAEKYFKKYAKARNAKREISSRLETLSGKIKTLKSKQARLKNAIDEKDIGIIESFLGKKRSLHRENRKGKKEVTFSGAKRYVSTDGFDILVGKRSKDNDYLTFRVAKSLDTWLHAADYPGSHVVIKNPNRKEIPQSTLREAAQLAAFYSKARKESKVGVHYTQKKFVNKPKGAAPGLVSLASFKTILVEPKVPGNKNGG